MAWTFYTPSVAPAYPELMTSLPATATNGDQIVLTDSLSAPTYQWLLQYVAAKSTNKWVYIGGPPIIAEVLASETTSSTAYTALATAGPSITIPVAGDYLVGVGGYFSINTTATAYMSYDIGGTGAVDADGVKHKSGSSNPEVHAFYEKKKTGLTAVTLTAKYKVSGNTLTMDRRWMRVLPIAVGG